MGILNITPDSFYDGGKHQSLNNIKRGIKKILSEGADIIDIGAYSSRPGADNISEMEELKRLIPALELINSDYPEAVISVDTFRSRIAEIGAKHYNVAIINDISAGDDDPKMLETVAKFGVSYIMMHKKGNPQNMQNKPTYENLIKEIILYFAKKTELAKKYGINDIIIDPGFGFGKTIEHNYQLLNELHKFKIFDFPLLVGLSRKSMIYKPLNMSAKDVLIGTVTLNTVALQKGANILRVHDVAETVQTVKVFDLI